MKLSLIVPTISRVQELERLLRSLVAQKYKNFEVIIVDQNPDDRLVDLVETYNQHFLINHLRESKPGLSRARNIGRAYVQGDIVAYPDDDSVYPPEVLAKVVYFLQTNSMWDGVVARVLALEGDKNAFEFCGGNDESKEIDYRKAYNVGISHSMFFRAAVVNKIAFDESLGQGAGTPWGAGEDTDYLFRCLDEGYRLYYDANLHVRHPMPTKKNNFFEQIRREYFYGLGNGYFLGTHSLPDSLLKYGRTFAYQSARSEILKGKFRDALYHLIYGVGVSLGYRSGSNHN